MVRDEFGRPGVSRGLARGGGEGGFRWEVGLLSGCGLPSGCLHLEGRLVSWRATSFFAAVVRVPRAFGRASAPKFSLFLTSSL